MLIVVQTEPVQSMLILAEIERTEVWAAEEAVVCWCVSRLMSARALPVTPNAKKMWTP